jgi:hypothetical protein
MVFLNNIKNLKTRSVKNALMAKNIHQKKNSLSKKAVHL